MRVHLTVTPLHVGTKMRVLTSNVLHDYPVWKVALHEYVNCPWRFVALRDISHRVAGYVRQLDPNSDFRGHRVGSGWRTKANNAENSNRTLVGTKKRSVDTPGCGP